MDNIAYLNYISSKNNSKAKKPFTIKKNVIIAIISVIALIIISSVASSISGALENRETDLTPRLYLRIENLNKILNDNRKKIKSSTLRAETTQLIGATASMVKDLPRFYENPSKKPLNTVIAEEKNIYTTTISALEKGRANDNFDSMFARYMDYYTSIVISLSDYIAKHTSNTSLQSYLETRKTEISPKQQFFSDFTDAH